MVPSTHYLKRVFFEKLDEPVTPFLARQDPILCISSSSLPILALNIKRHTMQFVATVSFTGECKYLDYCSNTLFRNTVFFFIQHILECRFDMKTLFPSSLLLFFPHNCLENGIQGY